MSGGGNGKMLNKKLIYSLLLICGLLIKPTSFALDPVTLEPKFIPSTIVTGSQATIQYELKNNNPWDFRIPIADQSILPSGSIRQSGVGYCNNDAVLTNNIILEKPGQSGSSCIMEYLLPAQSSTGQLSGQLKAYWDDVGITIIPASFLIQVVDSGYLTITADQDSSDLHLGYRAIKVNNVTDSSVNFTTIDSTITTSSNRILYCSPSDTSCAYKTDTNCITGGSLTSGATCRIWFKANNSDTIDLGEDIGEIDIKITSNLDGKSQIQEAVFNGTYNKHLYAGGSFSGSPADYLAKWDGNTWSAVNLGTNGIVYALTLMNGDLYAGGNFLSTIGTAVNYIAKWNGNSWSPLIEDANNGVSSTVYALYSIGSDLYVGGAFINAGGIATADYIAKWNGVWTSLGSGTNGAVNTITSLGTDLYAGGTFTTADGNLANRIAKWNGTTWSALGSGLNNIVYTITNLGTDLYAGGSFTTADGNTANRIAKRNGTAWSSLVDGVNNGVNNTVYALQSVGNDLYVGGAFTNAGGIATADYVAKWNGANWSSLGMGTNNIVYTITKLGTDLYVGGSFTAAGGSNAFRIAKWNGTVWSAVGGGFNGDVRTTIVAPSLVITPK